MDYRIGYLFSPIGQGPGLPVLEICNFSAVIRVRLFKNLLQQYDKMAQCSTQDCESNSVFFSSEGKFCTQCDPFAGRDAPIHEETSFACYNCNTPNSALYQAAICMKCFMNAMTKPSSRSRICAQGGCNEPLRGDSMLDRRYWISPVTRTTGRLGRRGRSDVYDRLRGSRELLHVQDVSEV